MEILHSNPMFPACARKNVCTLYNFARRSTTKLLSRFCDSSKCDSISAVDAVRRYTRKHLPAVILTDILSNLVPASTDRWRFSCISTTDLLQCKIHPECQLVYRKLFNIIKVLFSEDISSLTINLKTVSIDSYPMVIKSIESVINKPPSREFKLLTSLVISGGSVHSDFLLDTIQSLAITLKRSCRNLENLHLPVASNKIFLSISDVHNIRALKVDRTRHFNKQGLYHLCHPDSQSKKTLQVLHIGVFKHVEFEKQHVAEFLRCMTSLLEFSLLDSNRALVRVDGSATPGDKVLMYSVFKRAIRDSEEKTGLGHEGEVSQGHQHGENVKILKTNLTEMTIVDRNLKPHYILESAPRLSRLTVDWQQELSFTPFNRYSASWFTDMIKGNSWSILSRRLTRLDITFPSSHSINSYSLPLEDYTKLMQNLSNLRQLRLVGAGQGGPVPLIPTLRYCPHLIELTLEKSPVHVPDNYEVIDPTYISHSLQKFYYLGEMSSLLVHNYMMKGIGHYMPSLKELEVQPQAVLGYHGLTPDQVIELASLKKLTRLSVPLSIRDCINNLPQIIFVLREFASLRFLTLSWGMSHESYDITRSKIQYMMDWLFMALGAENANIHLQLSYKQHPQEYRR